jgi:hypothetical protein
MVNAIPVSKPMTGEDRGQHVAANPISGRRKTFLSGTDRD